MPPSNIEYNPPRQGTTNPRQQHRGARHLQQRREKTRHRRFRLQQKHGLFHYKTKRQLATRPQIRDTHQIHGKTH